VERKLATALFADLVDSTGLGEQDPERTRVLLERFYDTLAAEIELAGGTLEKFAGDAVMAVFGAPTAQEDHAERALHAALSLERRVEEVFRGTLQVRVGVNSGEMVVGEARAGSSFVTGDAVNVAARLEQAAVPGEVLAGERTVALARGAFEFGPEASIDAKGKSEPVACRTVVRALTLMRPRGVSGLRATFVGRDAELELLRATYRRALELQTPHLVTVFGDAGVGKTRLVRELWQWLAEQEPEPRRRTGRCLAYGHATYWALGEILKEELDIRDSDSDAQVEQRLGDHAILGLALGRASPDASPVNVREQLHDAAVGFFERLAADRPAIVLVEDLHWAEGALLELVERVLRDARGPLLIVATSRPELLDARSSWGAGRRNATTVWLEPLTESEAERLVDELPKDLRDAVVARAEGNPFFVEELVSSLLDRGVLRHGDGWETVHHVDWSTVPDTVQALLAARIDLLDAEAKATLQAAAVIGRAFWHVPLRELRGTEPTLAVLEDRDFIRRRSGSSMTGDVEYVFRHALTREVAYGSLPKANRAALHAQVATWLERTGGGRDEHATLLAHHYAEAARPEDVDLAWPGDPETADRLRRAAIKWQRRAAQLAISRYELDEAIAMLEHAASLDTDGEHLAGIWRDAGRAHALRFDGAAFTKAMELSLAATDDPALQVETLAELAYATSFRVGMFPTIPEDSVVDGWIADVLASPHASAAARSKVLIAQVFWSDDGGPTEADEAARLVRDGGNLALRSAAARAVGYAGIKTFDFERGYEATLEAMELLDEDHDREEAAEAHEQLVIAAVALGRIGEARELVVRQDELARPLSPHHRVHAIATANEMAGVFGEWEQVRSLLEPVEARLEANRGTPCGRQGNVTYLQAIAHERTGHADKAQRLELVAQERVRSAQTPLVRHLRGQLAFARGDVEHATELINEPFDPLLARRWWWFAMPVTLAYLDVWSAAGHRDEVERAAARVVAERCPILQPFALRALGRVRADAGLLREAADRFEELGLPERARETAALL
jgi:class 3 adenylate cyclase